MENPDKAPRPEAKLKNLDPAELDFLWELRFKDDGRIKTQLSAIQVQVPLRYGFTVSKSVLSNFFTWLRLKREWEEDAAIADQAKEEWLKERPDASPDELIRVGQLRFTAQSIKRGDDKAFVRLLRAITGRENAVANREKAAAAKMTKIEAGLEAMYEEIKGNPRALQIFEQLKAEVAKA